MITWQTVCDTRTPWQSVCGAYAIDALVGGSMGPVYRAKYRAVLMPWNYLGQPRDLVEDARHDAELHRAEQERAAV